MKKGVKRIIAREGLIIISILLLAAFFDFLHSNVPDGKKTYLYRAYLSGNIYEVELEDFREDLKVEILASISKNHTNVFDVSTQEKFEKVFNELRVQYIKRKYDLLASIKGIIHEIFIILILFTYPFYLIFRFIIWAIKILKEK